MLLLLDESRLDRVRGRAARGDAELAPALDALRADADKALGQGPWSVTDKKLVPPSGDKHDYVSLGPYWWPDPTKPDGKPYLRRDGEVNPESAGGDRDRIIALSHATQTLALAAFLCGDVRYARRAGDLLRAWFVSPATRMNPHLRYSQGIPGICDGRGIGIIDTMTLVGLPDAMSLLRRCDAWADDDADGAKKWMGDYVEWLLTSGHGRKEAAERNNHGTWYDLQVATLAMYVGREDVAERVLAAVLDHRIADHITEDGRQPFELSRTRSLDYSVMNLHGLFDLARLAERFKLDLWNRVPTGWGGLEKAAMFLAPYADDRLPWPHRQITPRPQAALRSLVREARQKYPRNLLFDKVLGTFQADSTRTERSQLLWA